MNRAFAIGSIPVRVHFSFVISTAVLGMAFWDSMPLLAVWICVVFVSVLIHELGHAIAGRAFGLAPQIDLHGMGGTTSWDGRRKLSTARSVIVSLAGPFTGIACGAALLAEIALRGAPSGELAASAASFALEVNIGWGLFNLLPILPLDGGNVLRSLLLAARRERGDSGEKIARIVSMVAAIGVGLLALLVYRQWWVAMLGAMFAVQNFKALREISAKDTDAPLRAELDAAYRALEQQDGHAVLALAEPVRARAKSGGVVAEAIHLLAYGHLILGHVAEADAAIAQLPSGFRPHPALLELRAQRAQAGRG